MLFTAIPSIGQCYASFFFNSNCIPVRFSLFKHRMQLLFIIFFLSYIFSNDNLFFSRYGLGIETLNKTFSSLHYPAVRVGNIGFGIFVSSFFGRFGLTTARLFAGIFFFGFPLIYLVLLLFFGFCFFLL